MGSGASSSVQVYDKTDQDTSPNRNDEATSKQSGPPNRPKSSGSGVGTKRKTKVTPVSEIGADGTTGQGLVVTAENKVKLAQDQVRQMEEQLAELESHNLDLEEQVSSLQDHIDVLERERTGMPQQPEGEDYSNTPQAKDLYIEQLERQTEEVNNEIAKLKRKYKRKLRSLTTNLTEVKQGHTLQDFELQQELTRLTEENRQLAEKIKRLPQVEGKEDNATPIVDGRTQIIVELSAQVSEQDSRITQLERELEDKERIITELQGKGHFTEKYEEGSAKSQSSVGQASKYHWSSSAGPITGLDIGSEVTCPSQDFQYSYMSDNQSDHLRQTVRDGDSQQEIKSVAREIGNRQKSRRMKAGRHGLDSGADYRESSGVSRDSGIVNPAERGVDHPKHLADTESEHSDWGDSDNDIDAASSDKTSQRGDPAGRHSTELDPYSIRRISAAKMRKGKKAMDRSHLSQGDHKSVHKHVRGSKPPAYQAADTEYNDLDHLLSSLGTYDTGVKVS